MKTVLFTILMRAIVLFACQKNKSEIHALMQRMSDLRISFVPIQIVMIFREYSSLTSFKTT